MPKTTPAKAVSTKKASVPIKEVKEVAKPVAKKVAAPAKAAEKAKAPAKVVKEKVVLPTKELKAWLKGRKYWNHQDWLDLLADLRSQGFSLVDTAEGQSAIGAYLESNRG